MLIEFTPPKIVNSSEVWYVFFRAVNPITGEKKLFKFEKGLNKGDLSPKDRQRKANSLRDTLSKQLYDGWNPFTNQQIKRAETKTIIEAIDEIFEIKKSSMKAKSIRSYKGIIDIFKRWLTDSGNAKTLPYRFTNQNAREYLDYLLRDRKYSGKSHNTHLGIMKAFFNSLIERNPDFYSKNVWLGIKELPEDQGHNHPFTETEMEILKRYFIENDPHFYLACCFTYYCFIRSTELIGLKVGDINLTRKTVVISSESAKNRRQQSVTIPKAFEPILQALNLENYAATDYIFGRYSKISKSRTIKNDYFSYKFRKAVNFLNEREKDKMRKIDITKGFYAWKHSGVCALYNATKDAYLVMNQCRHSNIKTTLIYLRSMGLTVNEKIREVDYSF